MNKRVLDVSRAINGNTNNISRVSRCVLKNVKNV